MPLEEPEGQRESGIGSVTALEIQSIFLHVPPTVSSDVKVKGNFFLSNDVKAKM